MAASKTLAATFAVALLALLTLTAAAPAADAVAAEAATAAHDALHVEGISSAAEAPALDGLAYRARYGSCRLYAECRKKKVLVPVKHSFPCYYTKLPQPRISARGVCRTTPYGCEPANCSPWLKCTCDMCQYAVFYQQIWCEI